MATVFADVGVVLNRLHCLSHSTTSLGIIGQKISRPRTNSFILFFAQGISLRSQDEHIKNVFLDTFTKCIVQKNQIKQLNFVQGIFA